MITLSTSIYILRNLILKSLNPHAVATNWGDYLSLNYFSINILNNLIVKMSSKIFENSFLKNGILEFRSEALIVYIWTHFWNDD